MAKNDVVGWHHQINGHEQTPGVGDGQGSLACCSPWGSGESDMTERLNESNSPSSHEALNPKVFSLGAS